MGKYQDFVDISVAHISKLMNVFAWASYPSKSILTTVHPLQSPHNVYILIDCNIYSMHIYSSLRRVCMCIINLVYTYVMIHIANVTDVVILN